MYVSPEVLSEVFLNLKPLLNISISESPVASALDKLGYKILS
jgi:hypothetical protein